MHTETHTETHAQRETHTETHTHRHTHSDTHTASGVIHCFCIASKKSNACGQCELRRCSPICLVYHLACLSASTPEARKLHLPSRVYLPMNVLPESIAPFVVWTQVLAEEWMQSTLPLRGLNRTRTPGASCPEEMIVPNWQRARTCARAYAHTHT